MPHVMTIGEILVEIMADERGAGFGKPVHLMDRTPVGHRRSSSIRWPSSVGLAAHRLCRGRHLRLYEPGSPRGDGVDVSGVSGLSDQVTGRSVRYRDNGDRDFVFNIKNSACGQLRWTRTTAARLSECEHLHVSGASLFSPQIVEMIRKAIETMKGSGGTISFDPNIRKEVTRDPKMRAALVAMLASCDIFLPSGEELTLLTEAKTHEAAIAEIMGRGVTAIVVKKGAEGSTYYDADGSLDAPGYWVDEVDPTGAGDCFGATFVTCHLQGRTVVECLDYANRHGRVQSPSGGRWRGPRPSRNSTNCDAARGDRHEFPSPGYVLVPKFS